MAKILNSLIGTIMLLQGNTIQAQTEKTAMQQNSNYSVEIIRYNIPAEKATDFVNAYTEAVKLLQDSPYCLGYNILHGEDERNHFIVTIYWTSKEEHLGGFRKSAEFGAFFNLVKPFYNEIEEMKHYNETSISWSRITN